jgi:putative lipoprotein (rSAM/lipoprotein system)
MNRRTFIKQMNGALAAAIGLLGFAGCEKYGSVEYGAPHADYTVKGKVTDKVTKEPIEGIRVGYEAYPMSYSETSVLTDAKGEYSLTNRFGTERTLPVSVEDSNGVYQSERLEVDFSNAEQKGKPGKWYGGEFVVTQNIELTKIEDNST